MITGKRGSCPRISERISMPLRPGRVKSSSTRSNGRSAICASPSSPVTDVSTSNPSISSRVCRDSRISASSSTMSTEPAAAGFPLIAPRDMTATSDMGCLSAQREVERKSRTRPRIGFHANLSGMLLNDAVSYRQTQPGASVLAFLGCRLGGEERIVNALNVLRRDAGTGVRNPHAHHLAVAGGNAQSPAARHRVLGVEEQIQKHLLQY